MNSLVPCWRTPRHRQERGSCVAGPYAASANVNEPHLSGPCVIFAKLGKYLTPMQLVFTQVLSSR